MILQIQHETRLQYTEPVTEWITEVRMEPVSDAGQTCQSFHLRVSEQASLDRYADGFGNQVHHFNILAPGQEVRLLAASLVEVHPLTSDLARSTARLPFNREQLPLETIDFLHFRGPVTPTEDLNPIL